MVDGEINANLSISASTDYKSVSSHSATPAGTLKMKLGNGMLVKASGTDKTLTQGGLPGGKLSIEQKGKFMATYALDKKCWSGNIQTTTSVYEKECLLKLGYDQKSSSATIDATCAINKNNKANVKYNLTNGRTDAKYTWSKSSYSLDSGFSLPKQSWNLSASKQLTSDLKALDKAKVKMSYDSDKNGELTYEKSPFTVALKMNMKNTNRLDVNCTCEKTWDL